MRLLRKILLFLLVVIAAFVVVVLTRPNQFHVSRTITIAAPPAVIFPQVNVLRNWEAWSPWQKVDPNATMTYSGPPAGVGASYEWSGNSKVGAGRNTIIDSQPNELVRFRLEFLKPIPGTNITEFNFIPEDDHTTVIWSMFGPTNFLTKAIGIFVNCDKIIGPDFEKGLANLKAVAEAKK